MKLISAASRALERFSATVTRSIMKFSRRVQWFRCLLLTFSESGRNGSRTIPDGGSPVCISLEAEPPVMPSLFQDLLSLPILFSGSPVFDKTDESDGLSFCLTASAAIQAAGPLLLSAITFFHKNSCAHPITTARTNQSHQTSEWTLASSSHLCLPGPDSLHCILVCPVF